MGRRKGVLKGFGWFVGMLALSSVVTAQEARELQPREKALRVPGQFTAPAGLCRLWIDGVPLSQQPAPTDCASAIRNRPANAAVVFGAPVRGGETDLGPFAVRRAVHSVIRQGPPEPRGDVREGRASRDSRDESARDGPRMRAVDSAARARKPEKPQ